MKNSQRKRTLRKEILILKSQAYRTEIRQELSAISAGFAPVRAASQASWADSPILGLLTSGSGRMAQALRWGVRIARWWPFMKTILAAGKRRD